MVFSSAIFLFLFLPVTLIVYYTVPEKRRNGVLLSASLFFYFWGEGNYFWVMLGSIIINYVSGLLLSRNENKDIRKGILFLCVSVNLLLLFYFKYTNFFIANLNLMLGRTLSIKTIHLPIGISFFTFQALSYVVDVYRKETPAQNNMFNVALYISLFPQLIAGPIVRFHDVAQQIVSRKSSMEQFSEGIQRFVFGLAKKMLIANVLGKVADFAFHSPASLSCGAAWLGIVCYTLQIYFDFSAYSDMAIGLGKLFGFTFLENFDYPYISRSIREFWKRWHISLSTWLRDYLYIPLGGNRASTLRTYLNLSIVFVLCGFWHGASWNFLAWGLLHGICLIMERIWLGKYLKKIPRPASHSYALLVVILDFGQSRFCT